MKDSKLTQWQGFGITVLRVVTGQIFLTSGVAHLLMEDPSQIGVPVPSPIFMVGSLLELLCGAALVVGLLTRWASTSLAFIMLVDILLIHPPHGFFVQAGFFVEDMGFEYTLLRLAACTALALAGPGKLAIDNIMATRKGPT